MSCIPDEIDTPDVLIDRDILDRNIGRMSSAVAAKGIALRPHVKTHKLPEIAHMQLRAGARPGGGHHRGSRGIRRPTAPTTYSSPTHCGSAHAKPTGSVSWLTALASLSVRAPPRALRTPAHGSQTPLARSMFSSKSTVAITAAASVPNKCWRSPTPSVRLGFTWWGCSPSPVTVMRQVNPAKPASKSGALSTTRRTRWSRWASRSAAAAVGPLPPHCSPPRTGPPRRPGVYVLGDAQQLELGRCAPADIALTVAATVVSRQDCRSGLRRIVLDCGSKILGSDRPAWATGFGRLIDHADARIAALSEHHATVVWPDDAPLPPVGTRLRVIPNHVCLTTNLVDDVAVVRDATLIDRWKVAARGKNH